MHNRSLDRTDYAVGQKVIHWVMASLIIAMLIAGQFFDAPGKDFAELQFSRMAHASSGILLAALLLVRIALRLRLGAPGHTPAAPKWQAVLSQASHWGMYVLIALLIVTGLATAAFATNPIELPVLGGFDFAIVRNDSGTRFEFVRQFHAIVADVTIGFVALHIGAAFYHLFCIRDRITQKMAVFWRDENRQTQP